MTKKKKAIIESRNYYLPSHFPLLTLQGENWKISDVKSARLHFHDCLEIGYCHSHSGKMEFYGEEVPFEAGDMTIVPRNVPHTTYSSPGTQSRWTYVFFDPRGMLAEYLPANWKNIDLLTHRFSDYCYVFKKKDYPELHVLFQLILKEFNEQPSEYQRSIRGLLLSFYMQVYRIQEQKARDFHVRDLPSEREAHADLAMKTLEIAPALEYIENNFAKQFNMAELAEVCHWSPTHFRRVFTSTMGISPLDYVNNTRIMKSCFLLSSSDKSILEISEHVGFQSVSSYNRNFKRLLGKSPTEYRVGSRQITDSEEQPKVESYTGWLVPPASVDES